MITPPDAFKQRELFFSDPPPDQAERAFELLKGLDNLLVERGAQPNSLHIAYNLQDYSLEGLEQALTREGFHLSNNSLQQLSRKLIYYSEEVEYHNLNIPKRPAEKRKREVFIKAYEHHLHGDHDDTPQELRHYK
jgi:hypothetical protein